MGQLTVGLPRWLSGKKPARRAGDLGSIPGSGRCPGGGNGNPHQDSGLKNPTDRGAWRAIVHGVAESDTPEATDHTHTQLDMQVQAKNGLMLCYSPTQGWT